MVDMDLLYALINALECTQDIMVKYNFFKCKNLLLYIMGELNNIKVQFPK